MPRQAAPQMPTPHQIREAVATVREVCPGARIKSVGPEGIVFDYGDEGPQQADWTGKPFGVAS